MAETQAVLTALGLQVKVLNSCGLETLVIVGNNQAVAEGQNSTALNAQNSTALNAEDTENPVYTVDVSRLDGQCAN